MLLMTTIFTVTDAPTVDSIAFSGSIQGGSTAFRVALKDETGIDGLAGHHKRM